MIKRDAPIPPVVKWLFGPLLLAAGALGLAVTFGLIKLDPAGTHAPLWIVGAIGVSFAAMGLVLLLDGFAALRRLRGWLAFVFLVSFASVFNWVAFGPGRAGCAPRRCPRAVSSAGASRSASLRC